MCWAAVIRGQVILHWFDQYVPVNAQIYLNMLETVLWPQIQNMRNIWMQQDGAPPHMPARAWLQDKFQGRVISRLTPNPWPARSPDLSCLDYWFWGVAMEEIRRSKPPTLTELKKTVESFADSLEKKEVLKAARHVRKRAQACKAVSGASFEGSLKKILRELGATEE